MGKKVLFMFVLLGCFTVSFAQVNKNCYRFAKGDELYSLVKMTASLDQEVIVKKKFTDVQVYSPVLYTPNNLYASENNKFGIINQSGKWVASPEYEAAKSYAKSGGRNNIIFKKDGKWGITNQKNEVLTPFKYNNIEAYKEGVIARNGPLIYILNEDGSCKFGCNEDLMGNINIDIAPSKVKTFVELTDSVQKQNVQQIILILDQLGTKDISQLSLRDFTNYLKYLNQVNWCYHNLKKNLSPTDPTFKVAHYDQCMFLLINFRILSAIDHSMGMKMILLEYLEKCMSEEAFNVANSHGNTVGIEDLKSYNKFYVEALVDFSEVDLKYNGYHELGLKKGYKPNLGEFVLNRHLLLKKIYVRALNIEEGTKEQKMKLFGTHDLLLNGDSYNSSRYTAQEFLEATLLFFKVSEELGISHKKEDLEVIITMVEDLNDYDVKMETHIQLIENYNNIKQFNLIKEHHHDVIKNQFLSSGELIDLLNVSMANLDKLGCALIANKLQDKAILESNCYLWEKTLLAAEHGELPELTTKAEKEVRKCKRKQGFQKESNFNIHALINVLPILSKNREYSLYITGGSILLEGSYKIINQKWDTGIDVDSELGAKSVRLNYSGIRYSLGAYKLLVKDEDLKTYAGFKFRHQSRIYNPVNSLVFTSGGSNLGYSDFSATMRTYDVLYGFVMIIPINRLSIGMSAAIGGSYKLFKVDNDYYNNPDIVIEQDLLNGRKPIRITPTLDLSFNIGFNLTKK